MLIPKPIAPGDTLGVIAPSGPFKQGSLAPALEHLRVRGYTVREGASLYERERYLAGTDDLRARDLNAMFDDSDIRGIFVARGGYGSARLLDQVDFENVRANPKVLVGFSDTTALQLALLSQAQLATWTGVTLGDFKSTPDGPAIDPVTGDSLWQAVERGVCDPFQGLRFLNHPAGVSGPMIGGCLSLVASLVGTPWMPDLTGAILFLEDVKEPPYRLDRMLNQLKQAGVFKSVAGVVFGSFEGCDGDRASEGTVDDVLKDLAVRLECPVVDGLPYGHGTGRRVLPVGQKATLTSQGELHVEAKEQENA